MSELLSVQIWMWRWSSVRCRKHSLSQKRVNKQQHRLIYILHSNARKACMICNRNISSKSIVTNTFPLSDICVVWMLRYSTRMLQFVVKRISVEKRRGFLFFEKLQEKVFDHFEGFSLINLNYMDWEGNSLVVAFY